MSKTILFRIIYLIFWGFNCCIHIGKDERAALAARIIYSNFQKQQFYKPVVESNMERLKRPSSLSKALIPSSPLSHYQDAQQMRITKKNYQLINQIQNEELRTKPTIMQDYQEPINLSKYTAAVGAQPLFNVEDEFKRKVKFKKKFFFF